MQQTNGTGPLLTRSEICSLLNISYHTLRRRILDSDLKISRNKLLNPGDYQKIFNLFGVQYVDGQLVEKA